jgi:hypothetical protein
MKRILNVLLPILVGVGTSILANKLGYPIYTWEYWAIFLIGMGILISLRIFIEIKR